MRQFLISGLLLSISGAVLANANPGIAQEGKPPFIRQPNPVSVPKPQTDVNSSPAAIELARHLKQIDAKMYGAFWCPYCTEQRRLFGRQAFNLYINYIECAPEGYQSQPEVCKTEKIEGYPTWKINGKTYMGVQSLEELAKLSGYQGSNNF
jgi:glutaredoxin/phage tail protein X